MNNLIIDILPITLLVTFLIGNKPVLPAASFNEDYLSVETGKNYRGLFAVVIMFHHLSQNIENGIAFQYFRYVGYLAAGVFFFFSGYGLQKSYIQKQDGYRKKFLLRRLPTVLFPYLIMTVIYWAVSCFNGRCYSVKDIISGMVNGSPIVSNSWYVISIFIFYIVFWLSMQICRKNHFQMLICCSLWYILHILFCVKMNYGMHWYVSTHILIVGMLWAIYEKKFIGIIKKYYLLIPLDFAVLIVLLVFRKNIVDMVPISVIGLIIDVISALFFTFGFLFFSMKFKIGNRALSFLGSISFELYMIHGLFINFFRTDKLYIKNEFLYAVMVIATSVAAAYIYATMRLMQ